LINFSKTAQGQVNTNKALLSFYRSEWQGLNWTLIFEALIESVMYETLEIALTPVSRIKAGLLDPFRR